MKIKKENEIVIYESDNGPTLELKLMGETLWLTQRQMAELFEKDTDTIGLHIKNICSTNELDEKSTTEDFSAVQKEGNRSVKRTIKHYNLDMIISVGYCVNSRRGTQFRVWANKILKEFLLEGYAVNQSKLKGQSQKIKQLETTIKSIVSASHQKELSNTEAKGILNLIQNYTLALDLLDDYDHQRLSVSQTKKSEKKETFVKLIVNLINQRNG